MLYGVYKEESHHRFYSDQVQMVFKTFLLETGKELARFFSEIIKICISFVTISFSESNLFLMEFMF